MNREVLLPTLFLCLFSFACSKHKSDPTNNPTVPTDPSIPAAEMVTTQIVGVDYAPPIELSLPILSVNFSNKSYHCDGLNFSTDTATTDKYFTRLSANNPNVLQNKTIMVTSSGLNYVKLKPIDLTDCGVMRNGQGGTFGKSASGTITIPPNAIAAASNLSGPFYYSPDISVGIYMAYLSPLSTDFALSDPGLPVGDLDGQRYYLNSAGIIDYHMNLDVVYFGSYTGTLTMPIASGVSATDSIPFWWLKDGKWTKSGVAHKSGANYVATVNQVGTFNFAQPVKGAYATLQFRTDNSIPLINADIRIKANNIVLFEGQTDWEGNVLVFLPTGVSTDVEMDDPQQPGMTIPVGSIAEISSKPQINFVVSNPSLIYTFAGQAYNCDGSSIKNGKIILYNTFTKGLWHIPVVNGTFNAAIVDGQYGPIIYTLKAVNTDANVTGTDTAVLVATGSANTYQVNTCPAITSLFMKYSVDGVTQTITGDRATPTNPYLIAQVYSVLKTYITTGLPGKNLLFSTGSSMAGSFNGSGIDYLRINDKNYQSDFIKPMRVTFDRYDLLTNGLVSGSAEFYYNDQSNVSHHVECSFQLVKTSTPYDFQPYPPF